jgi:hypothetical protein
MLTMERANQVPEIYLFAAFPRETSGKYGVAKCKLDKYNLKSPLNDWCMQQKKDFMLLPFDFVRCGYKVLGQTFSYYQYNYYES